MALVAAAPPPTTVQPAKTTAPSAHAARMSAGSYRQERTHSRAHALIRNRCHARASTSPTCTHTHARHSLGPLPWSCRNTLLADTLWYAMVRSLAEGQYAPAEPHRTPNTQGTRACVNRDRGRSTHPPLR